MTTAEDILSTTREHAVVFENLCLACLDVRGTDGLDLLHRLSTNDLLSGPVPRALQSILTTEKGRIIDLIHLTVSEAGTRMLVSATARQKVSEWVDKFTITEDINLRDISADFAVIYIVGVKTLNLLKKVLGVEVGAPCVEVSHSNFGPACFWRENYGASSAGVILLGRESAAGFLTAVESGGAMRLDQFDEIETLRVLAGEPAHGHELSESFNPLEVGLRNAVSFTKGCYVGQEVIARLDSYKKVQRELVAIDLRGSASSVNRGDVLVMDGEPVGILTSISPLGFADGRRRGLAVVRHSPKTRSTPLVVRSQDSSVNGEIVPMLPLEGIGGGKG